MENDVNESAAGEFFFRKLPGEEDLLYISIGTGIGAGIVLNGKVRKGARNLAGELGYAVQNTQFTVDRTQPGWLESKIGLDALKNKYPLSNQEDISAVSKRVVSEITDILSPTVANLATQLDIKLIVLGGLTMDLFGPDLFRALDKSIEQLSLMESDVQQSVCEDPGIVGAAVLTFNYVMDDWLGENAF